MKTAVWKMTNNKAPGKDNINVELIKYAPEEIYKEIANILNRIYERNDTGVELGTGILLPFQKPKKTQGPVKNLRPIALLEVIQKNLSKIFMDRTRQDQQTSVHITECTQKIQKHHRCNMGPQVDGCEGPRARHSYLYNRNRYVQCIRYNLRE